MAVTFRLTFAMAAPRAAYLRTIEAVAPSFGVQLTPVSVRDAAEIKQRITAFARETNGAIVVFPSPVAFQHRASIIAAAAEQQLPAMYPYRFFTVDGGLMSAKARLTCLSRSRVNSTS